MKQFPGAVVAKLNIGHMGTGPAAPAQVPTPTPAPPAAPTPNPSTLPGPAGPYNPNTGGQ
jgi:hypothetical protein